MKACPQTQNQSVYEHGLSVYHHTNAILQILKLGECNSYYKIPDWMLEHRKEILERIMSDDIIKEYTIHHDCGKPYCLTIDDAGKKHFPNHAEVSYNTWISVEGSLQAARLMKMDMMIHTMKASDIDEFIKQPEAMTLLIVGLAEVHANGEMFGGFDSDSFKIKWNQINRRGKAICKRMFEE
jgi:hypothetical protein